MSSKYRAKVVYDVDSLHFKALQKKATETQWMRVYLRWLAAPQDIRGEVRLSEDQRRRCRYYLLDDLLDDGGGGGGGGGGGAR